MQVRRLSLAFFVLLVSGLVAGTANRQGEQLEPARSTCVLPQAVTAGVDHDELCYSCTSVLVTRTASTDGSTMTTHSVDGHYEFRIDIVPGRKHAPGTMRPVYKGGGLGADRPQAVKVGEIPEVAETFTRYDASYPFMNEKQLAMGETTIGGRRELYNDEGILDIMELQRIALERAATAREAIRVMGSLASEYGYSDSGECLTIIDPNEVWMFEIFGAGPVEKGAVWAARRIPEGHVGVSANRPRITTLDLKDKDHYMASENVFSLAEEMGWWKQGEPFVFNSVYGGTPSLYSTRREWRVISLLAPSLKLDPWDTYPPFSIKPDARVSPRDLMRIHRDSYEGTDFDLTKGLAAGPFGNPNRWATPTRPQDGFIGWERSISIFRCSYAVVLQARESMPSWIGGLAWFAHDDPKTSCFVPFYAGLTEVPESYRLGTRARFERTSAWWAFNFVGNWSNLRYSSMIEDIRKAYTTIEDGFFEMQPTVEKRALDLYKEHPDLARQYLTRYSNTMAQRTVDEWWELADYLVVKYNDGYINTPTSSRSVGYPKEWLDAVGYGKTRIQQPRKPAAKTGTDR
jgi:dipeptidase